jgi:hypothetical protein
MFNLSSKLDCNDRLCPQIKKTFEALKSSI